jgi:hypothetical protein
MAVNMKLWNPKSDTAHKTDDVGEMLFKAQFDILLVLAIDVVGMIHPLDPFVKLQGHC